MVQSHHCAYLDPCGDQCRGEEYCQYKLYLAAPEIGVVICGKDQIIAIQMEREPEFDGHEITIGGA